MAENVKNAASGASTGASVGTAVMPGIGTMVGAFVGGIAGLFSGKKSYAQTTGINIVGTVSKSGFSGSAYGLAQNGANSYRDLLPVGSGPDWHIRENLKIGYGMAFGDADVAVPIDITIPADNLGTVLHDYMKVAKQAMFPTAAPAPLDQKLAIENAIASAGAGISPGIQAQLDDPLYASPYEVTKYIPVGIGILALIAAIFLFKKGF